MRSNREFVALGLVITAFVGGTIFMVLGFNATRGMPQHATALPQSLALPEFSLLDHHGAPFVNESLHGHWSLILFGFTNCPDICPATLKQLTLARSRLMNAGETGYLQIILVSVDPERDSPEIMANYVDHFGPGISGVTGELDEVRKLASGIGIYFEKSVNDGGTYSVDHSAAIIVINEQGEFQAVFRAPHKVDNFVHDMPLISGRM